MGLSLISSIPYYVYVLIGLGYILLCRKRWYVLTDQQRFEIDLWDKSLFREVISFSPLIFLYLSFIPNVAVAQTVLVVIGLISFVAFVFFLKSDNQRYLKTDFPKEARILHISAVALLLTAYLLFMYFTFIYLSSHEPAAIEYLRPFLLGYFPGIILLLVRRRRGQQIRLSQEDIQKLLVAGRDEIRRLQLSTVIGSFAILFLAVLVAPIFKKSFGGSTSVVLAYSLMFILIALFAFTLFKELQILKHYDLPEEYLRAKKRHYIAYLLLIIIVAIIAILVQHFLSV